MAPLVIAVGTNDRSAGTVAINTASADLLASVFESPTSTTRIPATVSCNIFFPGCGPPPNTPPVVVDAVVNSYNVNEPGEPQTLLHQFTATDPETPLGPFAWDVLSLVA